jgi:hypothetical protein
MLRALLDFAATGKLGAGSLKGDGFESPFEEAVARTIREAGFHVHPQVGVKGFRIDLGVIDPPRPGEFILGVECDGAAYHSARSARDRDRLRQQVLGLVGAYTASGARIGFAIRDERLTDSLRQLSRQRRVPSCRRLLPMTRI